MKRLLSITIILLLTISSIASLQLVSAASFDVSAPELTVVNSLVFEDMYAGDGMVYLNGYLYVTGLIKGETDVFYIYKVNASTMTTEATYSGDSNFNNIVIYDWVFSGSGDRLMLQMNYHQYPYHDDETDEDRSLIATFFTENMTLANSALNNVGILFDAYAPALIKGNYIYTIRADVGGLRLHQYYVANLTQKDSMLIATSGHTGSPIYAIQAIDDNSVYLTMYDYYNYTSHEVAYAEGNNIYSTVIYRVSTQSSLYIENIFGLGSTANWGYGVVKLYEHYALQVISVVHNIETDTATIYMHPVVDGDIQFSETSPSWNVFYGGYFVPYLMNSNLYVLNTLTDPNNSFKLLYDRGSPLVIQVGISDQTPLAAYRGLDSVFYDVTQNNTWSPTIIGDGNNIYAAIQYNFNGGTEIVKLAPRMTSSDLTINNPTNTTYTTSNITYNVTVNNGTNVTYQINVYQNGEPIGDNKTTSTGSFNLTNGHYTFVVTVQDSNGDTVSLTVNFTVNVPPPGGNGGTGSDITPSPTPAPSGFIFFTPTPSPDDNDVGDSIINILVGTSWLWIIVGGIIIIAVAMLLQRRGR